MQIKSYCRSSELEVYAAPVHIEMESVTYKTIHSRFTLNLYSKEIFSIFFSMYSFIQYQYFLILCAPRTLNSLSISTIIFIILYFL
jgi:hypothetical protein